MSFLLCEVAAVFYEIGYSEKHNEIASCWREQSKRPSYILYLITRTYMNGTYKDIIRNFTSSKYVSRCS